MKNYKFYTIDTTTDEGVDFIYNQLKHDLIDMISLDRRSQRAIHQAYSSCSFCYKMFSLFDILETYHDDIIRSPKLLSAKKVVRDKLDSFIEQLTQKHGKNTIYCVCRDTAQLDYIDNDTGRLHLTETPTTFSLFYHYDIISTSPYFINQAVINTPIDTHFDYPSAREYDVLTDDSFMDLIFNDQDKPKTYQKNIETPYNTRLHYRLKNKNFLKIKVHHNVDADDNIQSTATIYRDIDMIVSELKFWKNYFLQPHKVITTVMALSKGKLNMDCVYNIVKFV
jgi:hypothetical protein